VGKQQTLIADEAPEKGDILVVDDNPINLHLLTNILKKHGHRVRPATDGVQALVAARLNPPDLILLDVVMPEMDGYRVCQHLKTEEKTRDIPVLFISALEATEEKVKAFGLGGVDFITKPFKAEEVLARVETHLRLRALRRELAEEISELDAFAQTVARNMKSPLSLIAGYADYLAGSMPGMEAAQIVDILDQIRRAAHDAANIADELLLLARVRKDEVELTPVDMEAVLLRSLDHLEGRIKECGAQVILPQQWPFALGQAPWLEAVWFHYLSNGLKYGGSPPRLELGSTPQPNRMIRFWVRDNGQGLTAEEKAGLFTEFARAAQIQGKGHGLGLSIVHRIVDKLGGRVGVESQKGRGSTFWFELLQWQVPPQE
jgi:two-component system sensor histidine kinase/response regulator